MRPGIPKQSDECIAYTFDQTALTTRDPGRQNLHRILTGVHRPHGRVWSRFVEISCCGTGRLAKRRHRIEEQNGTWCDGARDVRQIEFSQDAVRVEPEWLRIALGNRERAIVR